MTDDQVRAVFVALEGHRWKGLPDGYLAYWRSEVEATHADLSAVGAWVVAQGGAESRTPATQPPGLRAGRRQARASVPGRPYYLVPESL
jgi:hypothetical protein